MRKVQLVKLLINIYVSHIDDLKALDELKASCMAVTTEFENIPAETLQIS